MKANEYITELLKDIKVKKDEPITIELSLDSNLNVLKGKTKLRVLKRD